MRRRRHTLQVSTFPFLAVLLCTMGSLIFVLIVVDKKAHQAAVQKAQREAAESGRQAAETVAARKAEWGRRQREARADWDRRREELHKKLMSEEMAVEARRRQVAEELAHVAARLRAEQVASEDVAKKVQDTKAWLSSEGRAVAGQRALALEAAGKKDAAGRELSRLTANLELLEQTVRDLKAARERERQTYSVIPYRGRNGEARRPLYVECAGMECVFHPQRDKVLATTPSTLEDEVRRHLQRQRERYRGSGADPAPYLLLLVRPDGISASNVLQAALRHMEIDFGYELVDADWVLDFPEDDRPLSQSWMAQAAPAPPAGGPVAPGSPPPGRPLAPGVMGGGFAAGPGGAGTGVAGQGTTTAGGPGGPGRPGGPRGLLPGAPGPYSPGGEDAPGRLSGAVGAVPGGRPLGPGAGPGGSSGVPGSSSYPPHLSGGGPGSGGGWNDSGMSPLASAGGESGPGLGGLPELGLPRSLPGTGIGASGPGGPGRGTGQGPGLADGAPGSGTGPYTGGPAGAGHDGGTGVGPGGLSDGPPGAPGGPARPTWAPAGGRPATGAVGGTGGGDAGMSPVASAGGGPPGAGARGPGDGSGGGAPDGARSSLAGGGSGGPGGGTPVDPSSLPLPGTNTGPGAGGQATAGGSPSASGSPGASGAGGMPGLPQPGGLPQSGGGPPPGAGPGTQGMPNGDGASSPPGPFAQGPRSFLGKSDGSEGAESGDGGGSGGGLARYAPPSPPVAAKPLRRQPTLRPASLHGDRDWVIFVECRSDGVIVYPGARSYTVAEIVSGGTNNPLVTALRQMIDRRQALVRPGEPPYRPQVRFLVRPQDLRTYHQVFPAIDALAVPRTGQSIRPEDDVAVIVAGS